MSNPVSCDLPESVDSMLQDIAQITGELNYHDITIANKKLSKEELEELIFIAEKYNKGDIEDNKDNFIFPNGMIERTQGRLREIIEKIKN